MSRLSEDRRRSKNVARKGYGLSKNELALFLMIDGDLDSLDGNDGEINSFIYQLEKKFYKMEQK